jgi:hypothetical protein
MTAQKPSPDLRSAVQATLPMPISTTPWPGASPTDPSGPYELRLAFREEQEFGTRHNVFVKPLRACVSADDGDAVGVVEKSHQPGNVPVTAAEGWVHEHHPGPGLTETIVSLDVDLPRWHPMPGTRRARIQIKDQAERLEDLWRRVPVGGRSDGGLMLSHASPRGGGERALHPSDHGAHETDPG